MIDLSDSRIVSVSVHHIPEGGQGHGAALSEMAVETIDHQLENHLCRYILAHFKMPGLHRFSPTTEGGVKPLAERVFSGESDPHETSKRLAQKLVAVSTHPSIKPGTFIVALLQNVATEHGPCSALALIKAERVSEFLEVIPGRINYHEGIGMDRPDKGCLIFDQAADDGYRVMVTDHVNRNDAQYWAHDFLGLEPLADDFHHTKKELDVAKRFVTERVTEQFEVTRPDQIDMLNRSIGYFKQNEVFNGQEFATEVFRDPAVVESFTQFRQEVAESDELPITDQFSIAPQAVKTQGRVFKSVLKLDKNFHIYIHGNRNLIESGFDDEKGMSYYKVFYKEEK